MLLSLPLAGLAGRLVIANWVRGPEQCSSHRWLDCLVAGRYRKDSRPRSKTRPRLRLWAGASWHVLVELRLLGLPTKLTLWLYHGKIGYLNSNGSAGRHRLEVSERWRRERTSLDLILERKGGIYIRLVMKRLLLVVLLMSPCLLLADLISFSDNFPDPVLRGRTCKVDSSEERRAFQLKWQIIFNQMDIDNFLKSCPPGSKDWREQAERWNQMRRENYELMKALRQVVVY